MIKNSTLVLLLSTLFVGLTSSKIPTAEEMNPAPATTTTTIAHPASQATAETSTKTLSYSELKAIATEAKGEKLNLREKLTLKLFKKKISNAIQSAQAAGGKSQVTALLLCFFLGSIGVHRFYLGYTWQGIVQILTLGGLGIWTLIDFIRIITGSLKPKDGEYEKKF